MTWLAGWDYRKSHIISYAADAGTNYQIKITVHYGSGVDSTNNIYTNSHSKTDFGDIRFTTDDGSTLLDYWMESKTDSNNAIFWIEVSGDLSTVNKTIYIYYGKSDATTTSSFDNTMIKVGSNPNLATCGYQSATYNVQANPSKTLVPDFDYGTMTTTDAWIQQTENCSWTWDFGTSASRYFYIKWYHSNLQGSRCGDFTTTVSVSANGIDWTDIGSHNLTSGISPIYNTETNGTFRYVKVRQVSTVPCYALPGITFVDAVYARKYVNPEPANSTWGNQESGILEDFTSYTSFGIWTQWGIEGSPLNIDIISDREVEFYACKNGKTYLYYDKGADYFSDFIHNVDVTPLTTEVGSVAYCWMLSNTLEDAHTLKETSSNYIAVLFEKDGSNLILKLEECRSGTLYSDSSILSLGTKYYLRIEKVSTALTCKIYSDAERTTLLDTLALTLGSDYSLRYIFSCNTWFTNLNDRKILKVRIEDLNNI